MKISDLKKVLNDIEEKYGDIEVTTYDEGGYTIDSEYVRVFEMNQKFYVSIGDDCIDRTCRNHGGCSCCKDNRLYRSNKLLEKSEQELKDLLDKIDFEPDWEKVEVTLEVTKVSKFKPDIDLIA